MIVEELTKRLSSHAMVQAIALSGSKTSAINDENSDWDIYIYSDSHVPFQVRESILSSLFDSCRINCSPFEEGDEAIDRNGNVYDLMYRSIEWTEWQLDDVWRKHNARIGYTTCFLYNISKSKILFDRTGWFENLQHELDNPYPEELRNNIIKKNMDVLCGDGSATFLIQDELAWKRNDIISQNHRTAAILSSYFDVLFAYNRTFHPGEKKLQRYAHLLCAVLPDDFDSAIEGAIKTLGTKEHTTAVEMLLSSLTKILERD